MANPSLTDFMKGYKQDRNDTQTGSTAQTGGNPSLSSFMSGYTPPPGSSTQTVSTPAVSVPAVQTQSKPSGINTRGTDKVGGILDSVIKSVQKAADKQKADAADYWTKATAARDAATQQGLSAEDWYWQAQGDIGNYKAAVSAARQKETAAKDTLGRDIFTPDVTQEELDRLKAEAASVYGEAKTGTEKAITDLNNARVRAQYATSFLMETPVFKAKAKTGHAAADNKVRQAIENTDQIRLAAAHDDKKAAELLPLTYLTEDEQSLYDYILGSKGAEQAQAWLDDMADTLAYRQGEQFAEGLDKAPGIVRVPVEMLHGFGSGFASNVENLKQIGKEDARQTKAYEFADQIIGQNIRDRTGKNISAEGVLHSASGSIGNMVPGLALGAIPVVGQALGAAEIGLSAGGGAYKQALDDGYEKGQAKEYAGIVGASEAGLQYLLGGFSKLGGINRFTENLTAKIGNQSLRAGADLGFSILGEETEEWLQNKIEKSTRNRIFGENNEIKLWDDDDTYTFWVTLLTVAAAEGGPKAGNIITDAVEQSRRFNTVGKAWAKSGAVTELAERARTSGDPAVRELAEEVLTGRNVTNEQVGRLAYAYEESGGDTSFVLDRHAETDRAATETYREAAAQDAKNAQEAVGDISVPPVTENAVTGESERLNRDAAAPVTETVAPAEETVAEPTAPAPAETVPQRVPAGDFTPKAATRYNPNTQRGKTELKAARELRRETGLWRNSTQAAEAVHKVAESMRDRGRGTDVMEVARKAADEMMQSFPSGLETGDRDLYNVIRKYLKDQKILISDELRGDITDFSEWKKDAMRKLRLRAKSGMPIDTVYQELSEIAGQSIFPADITAHSDQLNHILHLLDTLRPRAKMMSESFAGEDYNAIRDYAAAQLASAAARTVGGKWTGYEWGSSIGGKSEAAKRYDAIQQEMEVAAWESETLSPEEAAQIVDERYMQYGVYSLSELLNETNETNETEEVFDDGTDGEGEAAEIAPGNDEAETGGPADAGTAADGGAGVYGLAQPDVSAERQTGGVNPQGELPAMKRSQTESNTLQGVAEKLGGEQDPLYYMPITERQTLTEAVNRVMADGVGEMERLSRKEMWTAADIDTAMTIYGKLQADAVRSGQRDAVQSWSKVVQMHGTGSGQALQAFSKWTRSGAGQAAAAAERLADAAEQRRQTGQGGITEEQAAQISNDIYDFAQEYDSIEDGNLEDIRKLIKRQSDYRGTGTFFKNNFEKMLDNVTDFDYLKEYALRQMMAIADDATSTADLGQKLKTWQVLAQLTRVTTFARNIGGNATFGTLDTLVQDSLGLALDHLAGAFSGKREVGVNKGWFSSRARTAAHEAMIRSALEVAGDVNMSGNTSRYGTNAANRTFKMSGNAVERFLSRWEQLLGYSLQTSDATFRGKIEEGNREGLEGIRKNAPDAAGRDAIAENTADYELFQNKGFAYGISKGLHDIFNLAGIGGTVDKNNVKNGRSGGFGVGDFVNPYPGVPANLGVKPLEYSPVNLAKGAIEFAKVLKSIKMGTYEAGAQNKAVMDMARGLAGVPIIAVLAACFKTGIVKNWDDEDDLDASAQNRAEGKTGVQINVDAMARGANGGDVEWKPGDTTMSVSWLEPLNAFMAIASLVAQDEDEDKTLSTYAKHSFNGALQSALDMPVMQNIANIADTFKYSTAENTGEKIGEAALGLAGDALTGMIPAPIGQAARTIDSKTRDVTADSKAERIWNNVRNTVPGLRETLPEAVDNYGQPKESVESAWLRFLNNYVLPGQIRKVQQSDVSKAANDLYAGTGNAEVVPDRKAPNSMTAGDEKHRLTADEKREYQETYGSTAEDYYGRLLTGDSYDFLTDEQKAAVAVSLKSYAASSAKQELFDKLGIKYENTDWKKFNALADEDKDDALNYLAVKTAAADAIESGDFDTLDELLAKDGAYSGLSDEAKGYLDDNATLKRLVGMREDGVKAEAAMTAIEAVKALKPVDGSSDAKRWQKVSAIIGTDLTQAEKLAAIKSYTDENYVEKVQAAVDGGVSLEQWDKAYQSYSEINGMDISATQKATHFASALDMDKSLTASQRQVLREQLTYTSMSTADADTYDKLTEAGMDVKTAETFTDILSRVPKLEGKTQLTQDQKIDTILSSDLSEADKWRAMEVYTSESYYNNARAAYENWIDLDDYVRDYRAADTSGGNGLSQEELWNFYKQDPEHNETFARVMWLVIGSRQVDDKKGGTRNNWKDDWETYKKKHK